VSDRLDHERRTEKGRAVLHQQVKVKILEEAYLFRN